MRWAEHVACKEVMTNTYRSLVGKRQGKTPFWKPRREDYIKMEHTEIGCESVDWIHLAQYRVQWRLL